MKKSRMLDRIGLALPSSPLAVIIWREIVDALRDRRTILATIVFPILLIPIALNLPLFFISPKQNPPNIAIALNDPYALVFINLMNSTRNLKISFVSSSENLTSLVLNNIYDLAVVIPENFTFLIATNRTAVLSVIYDNTNQRSSIGLAFIQTILAEFSKVIVIYRLSKLNVDSNLLNPISLQSTNVRDVSSSQAIAGLLIPYFIGFLSVAAGASFATDTTAGEKERKTLEVFLTMPVTRFQILLGKYLGVFMLSLIGISSQLVGIMLGLNIYTSLYAEILGQASEGINLGVFNMVTIAGFALVLSMTGNAILMALSIFAKSFKEAQSYTGIFTAAITIPTLVIMYLPPAILSKLIFLPLLGPIIVIRNAVFNIWTLDQFVLCLVSSLIYLLVTLYVAFKVFSKEKVIFRV